MYKYLKAPVIRRFLDTISHESQLVDQSISTMKANKKRALLVGAFEVSSARRPSLIAALAPPLEREKPETCPECRGFDIVENWGEGNAVCRGCGLVLEERLMDLGSEWRTFSQEEGDDPNRVGGPANPLLENEMGTGIGTGAAGSNNIGLQLHKTQQRTAKSNVDKTMIIVIGNVDRMVERLSLSGSVAKRAKEIFKAYQDYLTLRDDGSRSRSLRDDEISGITAASLFIACRNLGVARTYKEICALAEVSKKVVGALVKKIQLVIPGAKSALVRKTNDFITRFCVKLDLPRTVINAADHLSSYMEENSLHGKTYTTIAATAIYVVSQLSKPSESRSCSEISEITGVAEGTIRSTYNIMYKHIKASLPSDFKFHVPFKTLPIPPNY